MSKKIELSIEHSESHGDYVIKVDNGVTWRGDENEEFHLTIYEQPHKGIARTVSISMELLEKIIKLRDAYLTMSSL